MRVEILAVGDELLTGGLIDTNSAHIAQECEIAGFEVIQHSCFGDHLESFRQGIREIGTRSDFAIVTGGLGPTLDDLTREAAAQAAGVELTLDTEALSTLEAFFAQISREMPESNRRQALFPSGALPLPNPIGTAQGFMMKIGRAFFYFAPGVPSEMKRMLEEQVIPDMCHRANSPLQKMEVETLFTFGFTEAYLGELLEEIEGKYSSIKFGTRAHLPGIEVKLYGRGDPKTLAAAKEAVETLLKPLVFVSSGESMPRVIGDILSKQRASLSLLEIDRGGLVVDWLTDEPNSCQLLGFSAVVPLKNVQKLYQIDTKTASPVFLRKLAALSCQNDGVEHGVAVHNALDERVIYVALADKGEAKCYSLELHFRDREFNRKFVAMFILDLLRRKLTGQQIAGRPIKSYD